MSQNYDAAESCPASQLELWEQAAADELAWAQDLMGDEDLRPPEGCDAYSVQPTFSPTYSVRFHDADVAIRNLTAYYGELRALDEGQEHDQPLHSSEFMQSVGWHSISHNLGTIEIRTFGSADDELDFQVYSTGETAEKPGTIARFAHSIGIPVEYSEAPSMCVTYTAEPPDSDVYHELSLECIQGRRTAVAASFPLRTAMEHFVRIADIPDTNAEKLIKFNVEHHQSLGYESRSPLTTLKDPENQLSLTSQASLPYQAAAGCNPFGQNIRPTPEDYAGYVCLLPPRGKRSWDHIRDLPGMATVNEIDNWHIILPRLRLEVTAAPVIMERLRAISTLLCRSTVDPPVYPHGWASRLDGETSFVFASHLAKK